MSELSEDDRLAIQIDREEIAQCVRKHNNTGKLQYGSSGMLEHLFSVIWCEESVPRQ